MLQSCEVVMHTKTNQSLHGFQQVCQQLRMRQDEHQRELFQVQLAREGFAEGNKKGSYGAIMP